MASIAVQVCQIKHGLLGSQCGDKSTGVCQYCGRFFCARHGVVLDDGQEVCNRRFCVAKRDDLETHLVYKAVVEERNERLQCGIDGCGAPLSASCTRCKGLFCGRHVEAREEKVQQNYAMTERMATLCHHCWKRRPIWLRT